MIRLSCHCGQIPIAINTGPDFIQECNCGFCGKAGARRSYFDPSGVVVEGASEIYCRKDKTDPAAQMRFCGTCGALTHFTPTPSAVARFGNGVMGVAMRPADPNDLHGMELRFPDGRNWPREGAFGYVRAAEIMAPAAEA